MAESTYLARVYFLGAFLDVALQGEEVYAVILGSSVTFPAPLSFWRGGQSPGIKLTPTSSGISRERMIQNSNIKSWLNESIPSKLAFFREKNFAACQLAESIRLFYLTLNLKRV